MADDIKGLIEGDKLLQELNERIRILNDALRGGAYIPAKGDPNYTVRGKVVRLPQFSDAYNKLIAYRTQIETRRNNVLAQLGVIAKNYKPLAGPETEMAKKEIRLAQKYLPQTVTMPTPEQIAAQQEASKFIPPVPMGVVPTDSVTNEPDVGGDKGGGGTPPKPVTRKDVTAALAAAGLADTPENRATVRADLEAKKTGKPTAPTASWEELVAQQAGEYAYLLNPKYEGVPDLLRKAVQQGWFKSQEGLAQFAQELKKTPYALNTTKLQQAFDLKTPAEKQSAIQKQIDAIRSEYGEIQFDQSTLEEVAGVAARNGSTGIDLGRLVYRAAFKRGAAAPAFTAPTAAKTALGGADADRIRAIYRAYGQRPDDDQIARILAQDVDPASGVVMTEDMLRNNLRDLAKVSYKPFADLLDRGVSVQTIFSPYQQIAASVLEQAPDQVALIDDRGVPTKFATALMGKEPMSLTDWITTLKSDDKYGWQFTNEAKQQASNLVMKLEKDFGFRA